MNLLNLFRRRRENRPLLTPEQHDQLHARADGYARFKEADEDGVCGAFQDGYLAAIRDVRKGTVQP